MAVLTVSLRSIFTSLVAKGIMKYYSKTFTLPVPANGKITIKRNIDQTEVCLVSQEKYVVSADNALTFKVTIDGIERMYNDNVVQETYSVPINWFELGAFVPIYNSIVVEITNKTDNVVYVTMTSDYGTLPRVLYDKLIKKYFDTLISDLGGELWKLGVGVAQE